MSATSVKLLQAAAEIVGGTRALARRLGISEALLSRFMSNRRELPDALLLRAVDVILEDVESRHTPPAQAAESSQDAASAS
jgi:DNA-binding transcriptional regulator YdaS (Cro superfamily)